MVCREQQHAALVVRRDLLHDLHAVRQARQRAAGADDVLDLGEVLTFNNGRTAGRSVDVADDAGVAFDRLEGRFFGQQFDKFEFVRCLRDRNIGLERLIEIDRGKSFAEFILTDRLDDVHAVDVQTEVALYGTLCLRLRCGHHRCEIVGVRCDGVDVCRRTADVDGHDIADAVGEQLGALHDGARCRDDRAVDHVADVLHARRVDDVILERLVDHLAARLDVEHVDLRIDVVADVQFAVVKDQLHLFAVLNVARVDDRRLVVQITQFFCGVDRRLLFAVVDAACEQDQVGPDLLDLRQVRPAQFARRDEVDDAACAERCLSGSARGHVVDKTVDGHLKTACSGRRRKHLVILDLLFAHALAHIIERAFQADAYVTFQNGSRRLPLAPEDRLI